eukprot:495333-Pyramimonas_sp.AAC.1
MAAASAHWDMEKLFDSVSPHKLMHLAIKHQQYPAYLLHLGLLVRTPPRALEVPRMLSAVLKAGESILAGCSQSMPWVKCYLYDVLERAHYRVPEGSLGGPMVR